MADPVIHPHPHSRPWPLPTDTPAPAPVVPRPPAVDSLTSLRGVAALRVAAFHFAPELQTLLPATRRLAPLLGQGRAAVPMFFVLSGCVLAMNYAERFGRKIDVAGTWSFWLRRLVRVYPLHLTTLFGTAALVLAGSHMGVAADPDEYNAAAFVGHLFLVQAWGTGFNLTWNGPSWSISSEWFAYLLFPGLAAGLWRAPRLLAAVAAVASFAGLLAFAVFYRGPFPQLVAVVCPFALGASAWVWRTRSGGTWKPPGWTVWVALSSVLFGAYLPNPAWALAVVLGGLTAIVLLLGTAGDHCPRAFRWGPLVALGEASYALYLTHAVAQKALKGVLPAGRFAESGSTTRMLVLLAYLGVVAATAWLAQATVERRAVPKLRRLLARRPKSAAAPR